MNTQPIKAGLLIILLTSLAACGGGGGSSNNDTSTPTPTTQSFSVSLSSVTVQRLSNDDAVSVDTSAVSSGTLEYTP